jgi:hypothetical protein
VTDCETAGADRILCTTCKLGGLRECAAEAKSLPLVEAERPKVVYRGRVWLAPPAMFTWSRKNNPLDWS